MIWAVGRNFALHAKELGNEIPPQPLIFSKAPACVVIAEQICRPSWSDHIHFETEIAFKFGKNLTLVEMALALDLTDRQEQNRAKTKGEPWTLAKSFIGSCPISSWISTPEADPAHLQILINSWTFQLWEGRTIRQNGTPKDWIFNLPTLVQFISQRLPIQEGDILLTGTPSGVGELTSGMNLRAALINDRSELILEKKWRVH